MEVLTMPRTVRASAEALRKVHAEQWVRASPVTVIWPCKPRRMVAGAGIAELLTGELPFEPPRVVAFLDKAEKHDRHLRAIADATRPSAVPVLIVVGAQGSDEDDGELIEPNPWPAAARPVHLRATIDPRGNEERWTKTDMTAVLLPPRTVVHPLLRVRDAQRAQALALRPTAWTIVRQGDSYVDIWSIEPPDTDPFEIPRKLSQAQLKEID
jgi:hypothetical protein